MNALPSSPPPASWSEPGVEELEPDTLVPAHRDTTPCAPPGGLDLTILPTVERAVADAARLTSAGIHEQARDSLRMAFMMSGAELGIKHTVLAALGDMIDRMSA